MEHSKNMLSDVEWLFAVLRAKTIFYEHCEKRGIKDDRSPYDENQYS